MSALSDLVDAVEALPAAYHAAAVDLSMEKRETLRRWIAMRLATAGAGALIADGELRRLGVLAQANSLGAERATAEQFEAAVEELGVADA